MRVLSEVRKYFANAFIIAELELRKIRHDQTQIWVRMVQPALWLAIYGLTMSKISAMTAYIPKRTPSSAARESFSPSPPNCTARNSSPGWMAAAC